jgi:hypothetical protein
MNNIYYLLDNSWNNIRCVEQVCTHNRLLALAVSPNSRIADECLRLIADNCQEGLQKLSISSDFSSQSFLQNVNRPENVAIRKITYLTLPDISLTDNELASVSNVFIGLRYLVIKGQNITDNSINSISPDLESLIINDAHRITTLSGALLKLKYIQITDLRAVSVAQFMSWQASQNQRWNVEILNLDVIKNVVGKIINHASQYGYESKYPLPGGYVSNFEKFEASVDSDFDAH